MDQLFGVHALKQIIRFLKFVAFKLNTPIENHVYNPIKPVMNTQTLLLCCELSDITFMYKLTNGYFNSPSLLNDIPFSVSSYNNRIVPLFLYSVLQHKLPY